MILRAKQESNVIVFELEGQLDFEATQQFRDTCASIIEKSGVGRVVFDFGKLKFVGSSAIHHFVRTLREFDELEQPPKLCRVSPEFGRLIKAYQPVRTALSVYEDETDAIASFLIAAPLPKKTPRRKSGVSKKGRVTRSAKTSRRKI